MLVVTVLYARVESACAGGRVYRGKKRMDVVGHGCVRKTSGGDLLIVSTWHKNVQIQGQTLDLNT